MSFRPSFTAVQKVGDELVVSGKSEPPEEARLVARRVAIQQGATLVVEGPTPAGQLELWKATLPGSEFQTEDALAIAIETYFRGDPASFLTFTWSEIITIT